jgi:hypothetical protein
MESRSSLITAKMILNFILNITVGIKMKKEMYILGAQEKWDN